jgi:hypothetical protein
MSSTFFHFAHELLSSFLYLVLDLYRTVAENPITEPKRRKTLRQRANPSISREDRCRSRGWRPGVIGDAPSVCVSQSTLGNAVYSTLTYRREPLILFAEWESRGGLGKRLECRLFEAE